MKLAFLGLGVMGFPMAGHLSEAGHDVTVYNRSAAKASAWVERYGGHAAPTPADAAREAEFVFACVGNDDDVRAITTGENGAFSAMKPDTVFVDHTTTSASLAREVYAAASQAHLHFLDAPVSGGQSGAQAGKLSVMAGGDLPVFARAEPLLQVYGKTVVHMGESGSGQLAKMANQICIAGIVQGLAEALAFSKRAGLDGEILLGVISKGAAGSWQMDNRGPTMLKDQFDFGFAVDLMIKDLGFCLDEARRNAASLPLTEQIAGFYRELSRDGGGKLDTSSLIRRLYDADDLNLTHESPLPHGRGLG